jgi:hypothetical protein
LWVIFHNAGKEVGMRVAGKNANRSLVTVLILSALFLLVFHSASLAIDDSLWQAFEQAVPLVEAAGSPIELEEPANAITTGDFNEDGHMDMVVAGFDLVTWLGDGTGGFDRLWGKICPITNSLAPGSLQTITGDFNEDDHLDVAVAEVTEVESGNLFVFLGDGQGGFDLASESPNEVGTRPRMLAADDLNEDGHLDVAIANYGSDDIALLLGNGEGSFKTALSLSATRPVSLSIGDFNEDSHSDVIIAQGDGTIIVFTGSGDGEFERILSQIEKRVNSARHLSSGDFNEDGHLDLLVAGGAVHDQFWLLFGDGDGNFPEAKQWNLEEWWGRPIVDDFNNDGHLDFATVRILNPVARPSISFFLGNGAGRFFESLGYVYLDDLLPSELSALTSAAADFNEDGYPDLVLYEAGHGEVFGDVVKVLLSVGTSESETLKSIIRYSRLLPPNGGLLEEDGQPDHLSRQRFSSVAVADLNGDRHLDLLLGGSSICVLLGNGRGLIGFPAFYLFAPDPFSTPMGPYSLIVDDFNEDGINDIALNNRRWFEEETEVVFFWGDQRGGFEQTSSIAIEDGSMANLIVADLNEDGHSDLVTANLEALAILFGAGDGSFAGPVYFSTPGRPLRIVSEDFNGDHHLDLAVTTNEPAGVCLLFGDGTGNLTEGEFFSTERGSSCLETGDFNRDGQIDLVNVDAGANLYVFSGDERGGFRTTSRHLGLGEVFVPADAVSADFNNDGDLDLVVGLAKPEVRSPDDFYVGPLLLLGTGGGDFSDPIDLRIGSRLVFSIASGDLNEDGSPDLVAFDAESNPYLFLNSSDGFRLEEMGTE